MKVFDKRCAQIRRLLALVAPQVPELVSISEAPVGCWRVTYFRDRFLQLELSEDLETLHFSKMQVSGLHASQPVAFYSASADSISIATINESEMLQRLQALPPAVRRRCQQEDAGKPHPHSHRSAQRPIDGDQVETGGVRDEERLTTL
jgi:hypothetical protein